jgi:hypothetical protein
MSVIDVLITMTVMPKSGLTCFKLLFFCSQLGSPLFVNLSFLELRTDLGPTFQLPKPLCFNLESYLHFISNLTLTIDQRK